ncbi:protein-tyrosine phosphatase [Microbacterium resistens]|uniref:Protein-tyrosine phosphatase n=1 Tax=Microbacterium resistens TaxID=156977 RepID=A0ABU1SEW6_9MICO|nr:tyrosine-protein phosphatase [Microbacterium resistens]MDR6868134.1 protein-tyrosine phosphatase [Microbacterium resistens]
MTTPLTTLDGLVNFRDLGGVPTEDAVIRPGVLYRAESLSDLTDAGREALASSGIGVVIDLRSTMEAEKSPGVTADSAAPRLVAIPMLDGALPTSIDDARPLEESYAALIREHGEDFARIAGVIADADAGVLVHCTAGKDRTGLAIALVLLAVGAEWDAVRTDYSASSENLSGAWTDRIFAMIAAMGLDIPDTPEVRRLMYSTSETGFDAAFEWVRAQHGSVTGYLTDHGLSDEQLTRLRDRLVQR